ncbi:MAG: hypothetical protein ABR555_16080, partial [Pyrinomonadaceae bacterium]
MSARYDHTQIKNFEELVITDGFCVLPEHFSPDTLHCWRQNFLPLLERHVAREGQLKNRGPSRYYVTLPFIHPFADASILGCQADGVVLVIRANVTSHK